MAIEFNPGVKSPAVEAYASAPRPKVESGGGDRGAKTTQPQPYNVSLAEQKPTESAVYQRPARAAQSAPQAVEAEVDRVPASDPMLIKAMKAFRKEVIADLIGKG